MFIWDFVADTVLGQIVDWIYGQIIGFLGNFFFTKLFTKNKDNCFTIIKSIFIGRIVSR